MGSFAGQTDFPLKESNSWQSSPLQKSDSGRSPPGNCSGVPLSPPLMGFPCQQGSPPLTGSQLGCADPPVPTGAHRSREGGQQSAGSRRLPGGEEEEQERAEAMARGRLSSVCTLLGVNSWGPLPFWPLQSTGGSWSRVSRGSSRKPRVPCAGVPSVPARVPPSTRVPPPRGAQGRERERRAAVLTPRWAPLLAPSAGRHWRDLLVRCGWGSRCRDSESGFSNWLVE